MLVHGMESARSHVPIPPGPFRLANRLRVSLLYNSVDILDAGASISVLPLTEIQDVQHEELYERNVCVRIKYHCLLQRIAKLR